MHFLPARVGSLRLQSWHWWQEESMTRGDSGFEFTDEAGSWGFILVPLCSKKNGQTNKGTQPWGVRPWTWDSQNHTIRNNLGLEGIGEGIWSSLSGIGICSIFLYLHLHLHHLVQQTIHHFPPPPTSQVDCLLPLMSHVVISPHSVQRASKEANHIASLPTAIPFRIQSRLHTPYRGPYGPMMWYHLSLWTYLLPLFPYLCSSDLVFLCSSSLLSWSSSPDMEHTAPFNWKCSPLDLSVVPFLTSFRSLP